MSVREIGRRLGRYHTTISREDLRSRPPGSGHVYVVAASKQCYRGIKGRAQHRRRRSHWPLWRYVLARLEQYRPREQIAGRLRLDFLHDPAMRLSSGTIYSWNSGGALL